MCEVTSRAELVAAADRGRLRFVGVQCLPSGPGSDGAIPRLATTGALAVYLSVLASLLSGAAPAGYRVTVEVENVRNAQGVVGVLVFNTAHGWPEQFSAALRAEARAAHQGWAKSPYRICQRAITPWWRCTMKTPTSSWTATGWAYRWSSGDVQQSTIPVCGTFV